MFSLYFRNVILVLTGLFFLQNMVFGVQETKWEILSKPFPEQDLGVVQGPCASQENEEREMEMGRMEMRIYGHRGGSFSAPENTGSSIREAFHLGAEGVEFDLQMTKDNVIIILHDETMKRTAAPYDPAATPHLSSKEYKKIISTPVQQLDFDQIRGIDVGSWKGAKWKGEKIITLKEALEILPPGKEYLVEVKGDDFAIIPHLKKVLLESKVPSSSIKLIGFGLDVMEQIKRDMPEYKVFYITEYAQVSTSKKMQHEIERAIKANMDGLDFEARDNITREVVDSIKKQGKSVIVWVPGRHTSQDSPENAQRMLERGVDIFTSNLPPAVMDWDRQRRQ